MKFKALDIRRIYESPASFEVEVTSEGILCVSGILEKFEIVEDVDGWN